MKHHVIERLYKKLTIENLWIYIIATLIKWGPTYGYDIKRRLNHNYNIKPATITVYTVLYRMEREGLIKRSENGLYNITEKGLEAYKAGIKLIEDTLTKLKT